MQTQKRKKILAQVCESLVNEKTKKREVAALSEAMTELGLDQNQAWLELCLLKVQEQQIQQEVSRRKERGFERGM